MSIIFFCSAFFSRTKEAGNQVQLIRLAEKKIGCCYACDGCMRNGGTCVQKDDMAEILLIDPLVIWMDLWNTLKSMTLGEESMRRK